MKIHSIYLSPQKGLPMQSVENVLAVENRGLLGDRYEAQVGSFSKGTRVAVRDVSLITLEGVEKIRALLGPDFGPEHSRRNIIVDGISADELVALVGQDFTLGPVRMRGAEICDPCNRPSKLSGIAGFADVGNLAGLRASILETAEIAIGDEMVII